MKRLLTLFLASAIFGSCTSDDTELQGKYVSGTATVSPIRLFTKSGEVKDEAKAVEFITRHGLSEFVPHYGIDNSHANEVSITFNPGNTAIVTCFGKTDVRNIVKSNGYIYLEASDITTIYSFANESRITQALLLSPLYSKTTTVPTSSGYSNKTELKHCYFAKETNGSISLPLLNICIVTHIPDQIYARESAYNLNNVFNPEISQNLSDVDTIAVQRIDVELEREKK